MKRVLRLLTLAGAVAGAVWYARQQSEPEPAPAEGEWAGRPKLTAVPDPAMTETRPAVPGKVAPSDDLTEIKGIGPKYAQQLTDLGITSFAALGAADPAELAEEFDPRAAVADWITQAQNLTEG